MEVNWVAYNLDSDMNFPKGSQWPDLMFSEESISSQVGPIVLEYTLKQRVRFR